MRKLSAFTSPRPYGGGFLLFGALAVMLFASVPARAANVTVNLKLGAVGYEVPVKHCLSLSVPAGAGGAAVLNAAVAARCIDSYKTQSFGGSTFVTCVDPGPAEICQQGDGLVSFWAYYKNGYTQTASIDRFNAAAGDELGLVYTNFLVCPTYPDCPL